LSEFQNKQKSVNYSIFKSSTVIYEKESKMERLVLCVLSLFFGRIMIDFDELSNVLRILDVGMNCPAKQNKTFSFKNVKYR